METESDSSTLEEKRLSNEFTLKMRELSIAEKRLDYEKHGERLNQWSSIKVALISVLSAIVSVLGTLAAAYFGGFFDLEKIYAAGNATMSLTRLQFSNDLIKNALSSTNPANSLKFYADIGLLDGLKSDTIKIYADNESARIANKDSGPSLLPNFVGIDGEACIGQVQPPAGLVEVKNAPLLDKVLGLTGHGGTCAAKVFSVTSPITIYRVFDASRPHSKFGSWWSFAPPSGSKEAYQAANAICPEWGNLNRFVKCEIRPGTEVVVGTTQSLICADGLVLSKTGENQVFVANDSGDGIYHVGACTEAAIWQ